MKCDSKPTRLAALTLGLLVLAAAPRAEAQKKPTVPPPPSSEAMPSHYCGAGIQLKSWKGDYLHRPDGAPAVTTWGAGAANTWTVECAGGKVQLKSWKGDYLNRTDAAQGVSVSAPGTGTVWTPEFAAGKLMLKSSKGDYLHRPDTAQGVTTWGTGIGNAWTMELQSLGTPRPDPLSAGERKVYTEDRKYVRSLVKPNVPTSLDYSDPRVYRFVVARLKQAGKTSKTAPQLFERIKQRRAADKKSSPTKPSPTKPSPTKPSPTKTELPKPSSTKTELTTISPPRIELTPASLSRTPLTTTSLTPASFTVPSLITASTMAAVNPRKVQHVINSSNFVTESSPFMEANALVTYPGGAYYLYVDSSAWDNNGNPLGVMGYAEKYNAFTARSTAIGDVSKTSAQDYEVDSLAMTDSASGLRESYLVRENNRKCQLDLSTLNITNPVNTTGGQCVDICLNRTWTGDCDYDLTGTQTALKIPLSGSIGISFNNPACVFDANRIAQYQNGTVTPPGDIKAVLGDVGGGCDVGSANDLSTPMQNFWQHVTLSNGGKTLSWNLTGADAALFDSSCRQFQDELLLTMVLNLPMKQGDLELPPRPIVLSNDPGSQATNYQLPCMSMIK